jgi:hypothetical protein
MVFNESLLSGGPEICDKTLEVKLFQGGIQEKDKHFRKWLGLPGHLVLLGQLSLPRLEFNHGHILTFQSHLFHSLKS